MSVASFPDVPIAAGVPAVLRMSTAPAGSPINSAQNIAIGASQTAVSGTITNVQQLGGNLVPGAIGTLPTALTSDAPSVSTMSTKKGQWGIFDQSGKQVIIPDSVKSLSYRQEWLLADYPIENGGFQSYNKVQKPFDIRLEMTKSGTSSDRSNFLTTLDTLANGITLYNINTPDRSYKNVSIANFDYKRTASNGVGLLTVDIGLLEIRVAAASTFSNTAAPNGANQTSSGVVQPVPLTTGAATNPTPNGNTPNQPAAGTPVSDYGANTGTPSQQSPASTSGSGVSESAASSVTSTETPAVQQTAPSAKSTPIGVPLDGSGNPIPHKEDPASGLPIVDKSVSSYTYKDDLGNFHSVDNTGSSPTGSYTTIPKPAGFK